MLPSRKCSFSGDTDKAALVLQKGFNQKLSVYGREIVIQPLHKKTTDFWPVVWDIRKKFNDRVRFIKLDFRGEGENKSADGLMALITQLARKGDCAALLELSHKPGSPEINLQELHDDLTHIAAICLNEGILTLPSTLPILAAIAMVLISWRNSVSKKRLSAPLVLNC